MDILTCPRCQRANPADAAFCHFDGVDLRPGQGRNGRQSQLPEEFVFPYGRRCRTFDELAQGCQAEWEVARELLKQGVFQRFLTSAGYLDLAEAAKQAESHPDPDIALGAFIGCLPATVEQGPRLDLQPRRLQLGNLHVNETRMCRLTVLNQGKGLLSGMLTVAEGNSWLRLSGNSNKGECQIKTANEQYITLHVDTHGLSAPRKCSAKLRVITNGGIVEVPVRLDVVAHPLPHAPFQGVNNPRELAEKMRTHPRQVVPLLEDREIARWFALNGWTYPVQGPTARGIAAVQQFFEGMGLSKPPIVRLTRDRLELRCSNAESVSAQFLLQTDARKWIYARVESDSPWLRVLTPNVCGPQQAVVDLEADGTALKVNRVHEATVRFVANDNQKLSAKVLLEVRRADKPPVAPSVRPLVIGAAAGCLFRLVLALPADVYARVLAAPAGASILPGSFIFWLRSPLDDVSFMKHFVLATWWLGAVVGAFLLWRRSRRTSDVAGGVVTGAAAGLLGSATLALLLPELDGAARFLWQKMSTVSGWNRISGAAWLWIAVWISLATGTWTILGAVVGFLLGHAGRRGQWVLMRLQQLLWTLFSVCRLDRAAAWITR